MSALQAVLKTVAAASKPCIIAVSGPQGSGKTTLCAQVAQHLNASGTNTIAVSLDDFYLPFNEQSNLSTLGNPLLSKRGLPGTHDVDLMKRTLESLLSQPETMVPRYDKSMHKGKGDRSGFEHHNTSYDVVLLEGWMVGFRNVAESEIKTKHQHPELYPFVCKHTLQDLFDINARLCTYMQVWALAQACVYLSPADINYVYQWRTAQEHELWERSGRGMTDAEVASFVDQYMPAYELYSETVPADVRVCIDFDHTTQQPHHSN